MTPSQKIDQMQDWLFIAGCWIACFLGGLVFWVGLYRWIMGD